MPKDLRTYLDQLGATAPEAVDVRRETEATRQMYGLDDEVTRDFGTRCLIARRLVERGVRFVQLISGSGDSKDWDHHDNSHAGTLRQTRKVDRPIAALLQDLADRGLLSETIVIAKGEFGRTPKINGKAGRDHWNQCYSGIVAGGGLKSGIVIGESDARGEHPASRPVTPADLFRTVLSQLGIGTTQLTSAGLPLLGEVIEELI